MLSEFIWCLSENCLLVQTDLTFILRRSDQFEQSANKDKQPTVRWSVLLLCRCSCPRVQCGGDRHIDEVVF